MLLVLTNSSPFLIAESVFYSQFHSPVLSEKKTLFLIVLTFELSRKITCRMYNMLIQFNIIVKRPLMNILS